MKRTTIITMRVSDEELSALDRMVELGYAIDRSDLIRTICDRYAKQVLPTKKNKKKMVL